MTNNILISGSTVCGVVIDRITQSIASGFLLVVGSTFTETRGGGEGGRERASDSARATKAGLLDWRRGDTT